MNVEPIYTRYLTKSQGVFGVAQWNSIQLVSPSHTDKMGSVHILHIPRRSVRIGIISDVHQNTSALSKVLEEFSRQDVDVTFALGDYTFVPPEYGKSDPTEIRASQFDRCVSLFEAWLEGAPHRHLAVMMGNHEVQETYFKGGRNSPAHRRIRTRADALRKHPRVRMPRSAFSSFEMGNHLDIVIDHDDDNGRAYFRRMFRLAHAVSDSFVSAMYRGLPLLSDQPRHDRAVQTLKTSIGDVWFDAVYDNATKARTLWQQFLNHESDPALLGVTRKAVTANICASLNFDAMLEFLSQSSSRFAADAKRFLELSRRELGMADAMRPDWLDEVGLKSFFNPLGDGTSMCVENTFREGVLQMARLLGIGLMYCVCGHFHADLGVFESSKVFGTHIIGVSGFQPHKSISPIGTAYIVKCQKDVDTIYKLSVPTECPAHQEFACDLSYPTWSRDHRLPPTTASSVRAAARRTRRSFVPPAAARTGAS